MLLLLVHEVYIGNQEPRIQKSDWSIHISYVLISLIAVQQDLSPSVSSMNTNCNCDSAGEDESTTQSVLIFFVILLILLLSVAVGVAIWGVAMMIKRLKRAHSKDYISGKTLCRSVDRFSIMCCSGQVAWNATTA